MGRRIELDPRLRGHGEISLVKALLRNRFAVARMEKIAERFPEMVDMPLMKYPPFYESPGTATRPPEYSIEEDIPAGIDRGRVEEYALELRKLADDYGLRCDWIIEKLHTQIRHLIDPSFRILHPVIQVSPVIAHLTLDIPIVPETRTEETDRKYSEEWQRIKSNPAYKQRQKPPLDFGLKVEWLGHRLIKQYTAELIRRTSQKSSLYDVNEIERGIKNTAKLLEIELPRKQRRKTRKI